LQPGNNENTKHRNRRGAERVGDHATAVDAPTDTAPAVLDQAHEESGAGRVRKVSFRVARPQRRGLPEIKLTSAVSGRASDALVDQWGARHGELESINNCLTNCREFFAQGCWENPDPAPKGGLPLGDLREIRPGAFDCSPPATAGQLEAAESSPGTSKFESDLPGREDANLDRRGAPLTM
jgi:hypothetical protein